MNTDFYTTNHQAYVNYLENELGFKGKTLIHYPDAVEKYMPDYVRRYIDTRFESFYSLSIEAIKKIFEQLKSSDEWKVEISCKTWNLRLKAIEHFIAFKESKV